MNTNWKIPCRTLAATALLLATASSLQAGGLVDTSVDRFDDADFSASAIIDNPWWTLPAGSNFLYFAESGGECEWNLVEVLNSTTANFGVPYDVNARIVLDRAWVDPDCEYDGIPANFDEVVDKVGNPEEATYDWFAQDSDGNIWYMGEDTYSSGGGNAGSFVAGCDGAEAGIVMLADPHKGDFYRQEYYAGEAEDWGKVTTFIKADGLTCLKIKEWSPLSTGHNEHKFYCSNGVTGALSWIEELKGKTVLVQLIGSVDTPPVAPTHDPAPIPSCPP